MRITLLHPVEMVSWKDCSTVLRQLDLVLPTEAQWEYAARGGTTSIWWTGDDKIALEKAANVSDMTALSPDGPGSDWEHETWDDGYLVHAPVGTFAPNAFGLHDVLGNVCEWVRERIALYDRPVRGSDGERKEPANDRQVHRGGSYYYPAMFARSAGREQAASDQAGQIVGVRPARVLER